MVTTAYLDTWFLLICMLTQFLLPTVFFEITCLSSKYANLFYLHIAGDISSSLAWQRMVDTVKVEMFSLLALHSA